MNIKLFILIISVIIIIIVISIYYKYNRLNYLPKIYYFETDPTGPVITVISGVHGNEPAPSIYFTNLIKALLPENHRFSINKLDNINILSNILFVPGRYYFIPKVNPQAIL